MNSLELNIPALELRLEEAFVEVDHCDLQSRNLQLRRSVCGLASTAIHYYLQQRDIDSKLVVSQPPIHYGLVGGHALVIAEDSEPTVIDATYSQFLAWVGVKADTKDEDRWPAEKILTFPLSQYQEAAQWLGGIMYRMQRSMKPLTDYFGNVTCRWPLTGVAEAQIMSEIASIYNPDYFESFHPSSEVRVKGAEMGRYLLEQVDSNC